MGGTPRETHCNAKDWKKQRKNNVAKLFNVFFSFLFLLHLAVFTKVVILG